MDKYELIKVVGQGSFGVVHKAVRIQDGLVVALKKVAKMYGSKSTDVSSLITECEIQRNLDHPNIIRMLDSFETADNIVIVTEFAEQGELSQLMSRGKLNLLEVKKITCDLVSALNYLFDQRILHRDLKPQNILIGSDGRYKLCDFGFAKAIEIDNYLLTSVKGTPLYMAPEMIQHGVYDQKAELWSLGCIIYEMLVGKPPFMTTSIYQLVMMIRHNNIDFPDVLKGDCRSFVKGLLEKEPDNRLTWNEILTHPFICDELKIPKDSDRGASLAKVLSPEQEKMREKQRQIMLHQKMVEYSRVIEKKKRKMEKAQKQFQESKAKCETESRNVNSPTYSNNAHYQAVRLQPHKGKHQNVQQDANTVPDATSMINKLAIGDKKPVSKDNDCSDSSCSTESSGSDEDSDEDTQTLVGTGDKMKLSKIEQMVQNGDIDNAKGADLFWRSTSFSLHSNSTRDKPIVRGEWIDFLGSTMKDVIDNPQCICEKHFLTVLVSPLRNHLATSDVLEKIADVLSVPFTILNEDLPEELLSNLQSMYLDSKILPNLLYACKVVVRRKRLECEFMEFDEIIKNLSTEDLAALEKCLRLVCYLVYLEEGFVIQFCDSLCVLELFPLLLLFLKLDQRNVMFTSYTLAILCQLMRMIPLNFSIVEELFFGNCPFTRTEDELWILLRHFDPQIKSRAIRLLTYLSVNSAKTREKFIRNNSLELWKCMKDAHDSQLHGLKEAVDFAFNNINELTHCRELPTIDEDYSTAMTRVLTRTDVEESHPIEAKFIAEESSILTQSS